MGHFIDMIWILCSLKVLQTPDFRNCKAANEIKESKCMICFKFCNCWHSVSLNFNTIISGSVTVANYSLHGIDQLLVSIDWLRL